MSGAGQACGSLAATVMTASMSPASLRSWGWRCPFWFGMLAGIGGHLVKDLVKETHQPPPPPQRPAASAAAGGGGGGGGGGPGGVGVVGEQRQAL